MDLATGRKAHRFPAGELRVSVPPPDEGLPDFPPCRLSRAALAGSRVPRDGGRQRRWASVGYFRARLDRGISRRLAPRRRKFDQPCCCSPEGACSDLVMSPSRGVELDDPYLERHDEVIGEAARHPPIVLLVPILTPFRITSSDRRPLRMFEWIRAEPST